MWRTKTRYFVWQRKNQKIGRQEEDEDEDEEKEGQEGEEKDMPKVIVQEIRRMMKSPRRKARKMNQEEVGRAAKPRSQEEMQRQILRRKRLRRKRPTRLKERI